jgi:hypothetical protein
MNAPHRTPTWRIPVGVIAILAIIGIWSFLVASASPYIGQTPILVQAFVYLVAGIVWIAPLRPLLIWMETGSFKAPPEAQ